MKKPLIRRTVRFTLTEREMHEHGLHALRYYRERTRHMLRAKGPVYLSGLARERTFGGITGLYEERSC